MALWTLTVLAFLVANRLLVVVAALLLLLLTTHPFLPIARAVREEPAPFP